MKKFIKISLLILFIIFVFGITTSNASMTQQEYNEMYANAFRVDVDTTAKEMLDALNNGGALTGITDSDRDKNLSLYCNEKYVWLYDYAVYKKDSSKTYPQDDIVNGYARSYILAAPGYIKSDEHTGNPTINDERQWAWYYMEYLQRLLDTPKDENGNFIDEEGNIIKIPEIAKNDLVEMSLAFQDYKKNEVEFKVIKDLAKTTFSGENIVYGPLQIQYSYSSASYGTHFDEWGGFDYILVDENGVNLRDKVTLCILKDGVYTPISSNINDEGYYQVRTSDYANEDIYMLTNDKNISNISIKIQENTIDYTATVYVLNGEMYLSSGGVSYCSEHRYQMTNSYEAAMSNPDLIYYNGNSSYKYVNTTKQYITQNYASTIYNKIQLGGTISDVDTLASYSTTKAYYSYNGTQYKTREEAALANAPYVLINRCSICNKEVPDVGQHRLYHVTEVTKYHYTIQIYEFAEYTDNNLPHIVAGGSKGSWICGKPYDPGAKDSQDLLLIDTAEKVENTKTEISADIELATTIEITKQWLDYENEYDIRPEEIKFNVFRSLDQQNWEKLTANTDYKVIIESKNQDSWKILITGLMRMDENENEYYFKVEEQELDSFQASYPGGHYPTFGDNPGYGELTIINALRKISLSGYVWLDGQTGIKPAIPNNGLMDETETRLENIVVYLYYKNPETGKATKVAETLTDKNGHYEFKDYEIGHYYVEFEYDGIHYEDTLSGGNSKAFEFDAERTIFNKRFRTITYGKSNDGTILKYNYQDKKSTLITNVEGTTKIAKEFIMNATTPVELITVDTNNLNLGLVKRGTDIALSTDLYDAKVIINGQATDYIYNQKDNTMEIGTSQTSEKVEYNLSLYSSDYNYRVRDYITKDEFKESDFVNNTIPSGLKTGDDLKVYVIYELNLQNQSNKKVKINEVEYVYDEKYSFVAFVEGGKALEGENTLTIDLDGLELKDGETKTIHLIFEVNETNNAVDLGKFINKAEITSYSTEEGLIDVDSQPGNFIKDNQVEDDNDTAGGLGIKLLSDERTIKGKVFDKAGGNVNDVIVQLIELKTVDNKVYEYIWQETTSGSNKGLRLNANGTALEEYAYTKADGYYEFKGFIPGDYIVRFIYGDGTTYDMTDNVIKYNGQDYKSVADNNYKAELYNESAYTEGASVARDNEARRLETMAYSVEINMLKGMLLKLLDNPSVDELNEKEAYILLETYNFYYNSDIEELTSECINKILKDLVLPNTWMCAETSKIKVTVDNGTETIINNGIPNDIPVKASYDNINLGLELRPKTDIELKKYITGFKLIAADGTTLVNAYVDVNEYLNGVIDVSNKVQGIKDNVTILDTVWQYEVSPTEINTVVDGASLEFEYTLVVENKGDTDYLSAELANKYANSTVADYKAFLTGKANDLKTAMKNGTYRSQIGSFIGSSYYLGGTGSNKVLTEVTNIRDYVNNDLTFVFSYAGKVGIDDGATHTYSILSDDYSMQNATIDTVLKTTESTGKMNNTDSAVMYTVTLGKNPISSTGNLSFDTYIAEVINYTNAAGRRDFDSTPANAEIIDSYPNDEVGVHEDDEADTGRIQIGVATGEDKVANYNMIIAVAAGFVIIAAGALAVKKYIMK